MSSGRRYRQYAEECLRTAQAATPVQRAHLLRVARTWFEIADQLDASDGLDAAIVRAAKLAANTQIATYTEELSNDFELAAKENDQTYRAGE